MGKIVAVFAVALGALLAAQPLNSQGPWDGCWNCSIDVCNVGYSQGFTGCQQGIISPSEPGDPHEHWCSSIPYAECDDWGEPEFHMSGIASGVAVAVSDDGILRGGCGNWILGLAPDYRSADAETLRAIVV